MIDGRTALLGLVPACRALHARSQLVVRAAPGSFFGFRYFAAFLGINYGVKGKKRHQTQKNCMRIRLYGIVSVPRNLNLGGGRYAGVPLSAHPERSLDALRDADH